MWALTSEAIMLTGDTVVVTSWTTLGLEGRRPLRPFRLSVLTTGKMVTPMLIGKLPYVSFWCEIDKLPTSSSHLTSKFYPDSSVFLLNSPSLTMPTVRHFWKRQNWHRFRLLLSTGQSLLARQTYLEFFCTVRCEIRRRITLNMTQRLAG